MAWKAEGCGSVADKAAYPLHHPLKNFPLPHVVQQAGWYDSIKGSGHVV